ncbi:SDR family NAD(P)-dependent oxidoreductase [Granulosicoccus antarcticus]|uniref:Gluconate 5-dehydrogenase n=1 Tax=Granulosicoccus antarcticus IMCC3135 TaxID=1192854 RepID=A0A2Z2NZP9_9GAMM|nr:SDR family oxidoreductase [Granulosicoccus antarcticus]ASJ75258.1 Gluconate 5-dehydrogenase [Granulosicoccus antarcticus IMCC3135]
MVELTGKVALVTGATSGIGRQQALALSKAGAKVVVLGRRAEQLEETVACVRKAGGEVSALQGALAMDDNLANIASQAAEFYGDIDILFNTAGVNLRQHADDVTMDSWKTTLDLNLAVPFFLAQQLVPGMRKKGWGRIVNIASLQSTRAFANGIAYGASKGGISQLTRAMAEAWSADGINCNAIAPGFFPTELTARLFEDEATTQRLADSTAIGRNGKLDDLDGVTVFLASSASDYITGQTISVDGGFTAR